MENGKIEIRGVVGVGGGDSGKAGRGQIVESLSWERFCYWQWGALKAFSEEK